MPETVTVTVHYLFRPGMEVSGRQELEEFVALNRAFSGCISSVIHRDLKNAASYMTISKWESMDQFMKLLNEEHIKLYAEKSRRILIKPFKVQIWKEIDNH
ncbi:MAG: antibiotic biosynthesis monooxygenase [Proteobacteria bacterium]|nr:antibiotic biosynthesis monooxygenase [Pseudomonadota bacterium]